MNYLSILAILFGLLLFSSPAFGYTASKFVSDYDETLSEGQKIKVLVKVKGEPESKDPAKRAKEIRHLQSSVLKFCNFAGATNVKSDSWKNEFTAIVTTSLAQVLEERSDVILVELIGEPSLHTYGINYYDLNLIDLKVVDIQKLSMDDTPNYSLDDSDLLKVTINITNNNLDYFLVQDKMFKVLVMEPDFLRSTPENQVFEMVDNYETSYDAELEVRYDDLPSSELFQECNFTNDRIMIGQSKVFTLCFDVLRIWQNEILNLDGKKKYFLSMMDNSKTTSCPNCKKILLSVSNSNLEKEEIIPKWIQKIFDWHEKGLISTRELQNSINYLESKGIISENLSSNSSFPINSLEEKNRQLKVHQAQLSRLDNNNLQVSHQQFYESKYLSDNFTGLFCKQQNNIVTLDGDYTNNEDIFYDSIFFKLYIFDDFGTVITTGISKTVDVASKEFRHFSVSALHQGDLNHCLVLVDSKFSKASIES